LSPAVEDQLKQSSDNLAVVLDICVLQENNLPRSEIEHPIATLPFTVRRYGEGIVAETSLDGAL